MTPPSACDLEEFNTINGYNSSKSINFFIYKAIECGSISKEIQVLRSWISELGNQDLLERMDVFEFMVERTGIDELENLLKTIIPVRQDLEELYKKKKGIELSKQEITKEWGDISEKTILIYKEIENYIYKDNYFYNFSLSNKLLTSLDPNGIHALLKSHESYKTKKEIIYTKINNLADDIGEILIHQELDFNQFKYLQKLFDNIKILDSLSIKASDHNKDYEEIIEKEKALYNEDKKAFSMLIERMRNTHLSGLYCLFYILREMRRSNAPDKQIESTFGDASHLSDECYIR